MFLYVSDVKSKELLLLSGYKFITTNILNGKEVYIFEDNKNKTFSKEIKVFRTNKMYF